MNSFEEKRSLLLEMISFSIVDGKLHQRELDFIWIVAKELSFTRAEYSDLFHQELPHLPIKSEFQRIQQFFLVPLHGLRDVPLHHGNLHGALWLGREPLDIAQREGQGKQHQRHSQRLPAALAKLGELGEKFAVLAAPFSGREQEFLSI